MKILLFLSLAVVHGLCAHAQYAPQAGQPGSTAISAASGRFAEWATGCTLQRGLMDIADAPAGYASLGDSSMALGPQDGYIVSLGDSGIATLTFAHPIINGPGADFAVFENGFANPANAAQAFLELAFVEVSSDGAHFVRFPSASVTPANIQADNHTYLDATMIDNLAGKYIAGYGTPFDLSQLADSPHLNVNHITHVRIVDVVGAVGAHASHDAAGRVINDPYPTAFASSGFDLDAVGVINAADVSVRQLSAGPLISIYPNPATGYITIVARDAAAAGLGLTITTMAGTVIERREAPDTSIMVDVSNYPPGMYFLILSDASGNKWTEKFTRG